MVVSGVWEFWNGDFIDWNILFGLLILLVVFLVWNLLIRVLNSGVYRLLIEDRVGIWIVFFCGVVYVGLLFCMEWVFIC